LERSSLSPTSQSWVPFTLEGRVFPHRRLVQKTGAHRRLATSTPRSPTFTSHEAFELLAARPRDRAWQGLVINERMARSDRAVLATVLTTATALYGPVRPAWRLPCSLHWPWRRRRPCTARTACPATALLPAPTLTTVINYIVIDLDWQSIQISIVI